MRNDVDDAASLSLSLPAENGRKGKEIDSFTHPPSTDATGLPCGRNGSRVWRPTPKVLRLWDTLWEVGAAGPCIVQSVYNTSSFCVCVWRRACCDTGAPPPPDIVRRQVPHAPRRREKYGWGYRVPRNKPLGRSSSLEMPLSLSSYLTFVRFFSNIYINSPLPARRWSHIDARGLCGVGLQSKHRHTGSRDVRISKK